MAMHSKNCVTTFSRIFHFSLKDFSKKSMIFFSQIPDALGVYKLKKRKTYFGVRYGFVHRMLGLDLDYCNGSENTEERSWKLQCISRE